jgi:hypothetical protein
MRIVKPGVLPGDQLMHGTCLACGCQVEAKRSEVEAKAKGAKKQSPVSPAAPCPTTGCNGSIVMASGPATTEQNGLNPPGPWQKFPRRPYGPRGDLKAALEVLRQRAENPGGSGCCDRYADNMACDCLDRLMAGVPGLSLIHI